MEPINPELGCDKGVHLFPKSICPKINVIERLGFELAVTVQYVSHYAMGTFLIGFIFFFFFLVVLCWINLFFFLFASQNMWKKGTKQVYKSERRHILAKREKEQRQLLIFSCSVFIYLFILKVWRGFGLFFLYRLEKLKQERKSESKNKILRWYLAIAAKITRVGLTLTRRKSWIHHRGKIARQLVFILISTW